MRNDQLFGASGLTVEDAGTFASNVMGLLELLLVMTTSQANPRSRAAEGGLSIVLNSDANGRLSSIGNTAEFV